MIFYLLYSIPLTWIKFPLTSWSISTQNKQTSSFQTNKMNLKTCMDCETVKARPIFIYRLPAQKYLQFSTKLNSLYTFFFFSIVCSIKQKRATKTSFYEISKNKLSVYFSWDMFRIFKTSRKNIFGEIFNFSPNRTVNVWGIRKSKWNWKIQE